MTLVVLAAAQDLADDVDAAGLPRLRAVLSVAGMTVIEQQAEHAKSVGGERLLVLVDGVPPALTAACDRIRARGLGVELVRDAGDVRRHTANASSLILVADGLIAGASAWQAIAAARDDAVLVTDDIIVTQALERIDPTTRWAGLATLGANSCDGLQSVQSDWDPQLTLLRQAVQDGATRIAWDSALFVQGDIALITTGASAATIEQRLIAADQMQERGVGRRWLVGSFTRVLARPLLASAMSGQLARAGAIVAGGLAIAALISQHSVLGLSFAFLAVVLHGIADFVARFRPERKRWSVAGRIGLALTLLALGVAFIERGAGLTWRIDFFPVSMVLLGEWFRLRGWGYLIDLPAAWAGLIIFTPLMGLAYAGTGLGFAALLLIIYGDRLQQRIEGHPGAV